ncbi:MAG: hypothetical protein R3C05_14110 [Pirellulaceae bacterium]
MVSQQSKSSFQTAMSVATRRKTLGKCALLAWIAACNGTITKEQHERLRDLTTTEDDSILNMALMVVQKPVSEDLACACRAIQELPASEKRAFLADAISVAIAGGTLSIPANHILRLLADVVELNVGEIYQQCVKKPLPTPGDPSNASWWQPEQTSSTNDKRQGDPEQSSKERS